MHTPEINPHAQKAVYCCVSNVLSDDVSIIDTAKRVEVARPNVGQMPKRRVTADVQ